MIEAWWRSLKHRWRFLHPLASVAPIRRLVAFSVDAHNRVLPHSAFLGQAPDEMYVGTGDGVPTDLTSRAAAARRARVEANRSASCETGRSLIGPASCLAAERRSDDGPRALVRLEATGGRTGTRAVHAERGQSRLGDPDSLFIDRPLPP